MKNTKYILQILPKMFFKSHMLLTTEEWPMGIAVRIYRLLVRTTPSESQVMLIINRNHSSLEGIFFLREYILTLFKKLEVIAF